MTKKVSRITAVIMLLVAVGFICYAFQHPEGAWPWSNTITFALYRMYIIVMILLFIAPFKNKKPLRSHKRDSENSYHG
ncbi:MAG: hypothetical protein K2O18_13295 [Oscillospiraceae bacterium]|nr:hypothetical protein [Oscillospiraceae bacterium]